MPTYKDSKTGKWYCQFYYLDWQGKRRHKVKRGFDRKKDADTYEKNFDGTGRNMQVKMSTIIARYIEHLEAQMNLKNLKPSTVSTKKKYISLYIGEYFSGVTASNIKPKDINSWLSSISTIKLKELSPNNRYYLDRGLDVDKDRKTSLSSRTLNTAKSILSQIFKFGMKNYGLTTDPTAEVDVIKFYSNDKRAKLWTLEQYYAFYSSLDNETYRVFYNLLYWSGLRIGEALALTPADVEPYKLNIHKNLVTIAGKETITTPKTASSVRMVEIPKPLFFQLNDYISRIYGLGKHDRIFHINEQTIREHLNIKARVLGLPKISPHILRHSYASLLYNKTRDITVVASQIGHKDASVTYKYYAHMLPGENRSGVDKLEELDVDGQAEMLIISTDQKADYTAR